LSKINQVARRLLQGVLDDAPASSASASAAASGKKGKARAGGGTVDGVEVDVEVIEREMRVGFIVSPFSECSAPSRSACLRRAFVVEKVWTDDKDWNG
jgi:hypothetical protein